MTQSTNHQDKQWRPCPICRGDRHEPKWTKGELQVVRCSHCRMLFANPVGTRFATGDFYERLAQPYYLSKDKLAGDYANVRFARERQIFRRHCLRGNVLDVGCSTGGFLHSLRIHYPGDYETLGTDVVEPALDYAERHGISVMRQPFLEADFGSRRFSAITFWAVLEHLVEPREFLAKAATMLEQGGHCFVSVRWSALGEWHGSWRR